MKRQKLPKWFEYYIRSPLCLACSAVAGMAWGITQLLNQEYFWGIFYCLMGATHECLSIMVWRQKRRFARFDQDIKDVMEKLKRDG